MERYTFRDRYGVADIRQEARSDKEIFSKILERLAQFEDSAECAKGILKVIEIQHNDRTNMLELHPKAKFITVGEEQRSRIAELQSAFSDLFYELDKLCDDSNETKQAYLRLEESLFWATKSISREKAGD